MFAYVRDFPRCLGAGAAPKLGPRSGLVAAKRRLAHIQERDGNWLFLSYEALSVGFSSNSTNMTTNIKYLPLLVGIAGSSGATLPRQHMEMSATCTVIQR